MSKNATKHFFSHDIQDQKSMVLWDFPQEIGSGAISLSEFHPGFLDVQANTDKGLWDLYAIPKAQVPVDELLEFLWNMSRRHRMPRLPWRTRNTSIIPANIATTLVAVEPFATLEDRASRDEEILDDWRSSPSELLTKLQDPATNRNELFEAILFAEIAKFDESQTKLLLTRLFAFVNEYRLSQNKAVKTAVGAAIRKLAMNLQDSQIEQYAGLFLPTDTDTLPCEIELELAKAILWRLATIPASLSQAFPKLEIHLAELASDYLKPRLLLQKNYASVALQAALGVLLLNGQNANHVLQSVKDLEIGWFTDLFQRRLGKLRTQLVDIGDATSMAIATNLGRFESEFSVH